MKKQILLVQSLLLLPLVSTSSLLGMDYEQPTTVATSTTEHSDLSGSIPLLFGEGTTPLSDSTLELNEVYAEMERVDKEMAALERDAYLAITWNQDLPLSPEEQLELADKKYYTFKAIHDQVLSNQIILNSPKQEQKTIELDSTADINKTVVAPLEAWKTAKVITTEDAETKLSDNQLKLLNAIVKEKVTLKAPEAKVATVKEREYWVENHNKFQGVLNQLVNNPIELKEPKKLPTHQEMLTKSIMITQTPAKTGLDDLPYKYQAGYKLGTHKAHHIIEYLFTDVAKTEKKKYKFAVDGIDNIETAHTAEYLFDLTNKTHVQLLEDTLEYYMSQNDTQALMTLLEKCQCTAGELQINPRVAGDLDLYFETVTKDKETETQLTLKKQQAEYAQKANALVMALQKEVAQRVEELDKEYDKYAEATNNAFIKNADHIRQLNENALAAYSLSPHYAYGKSKSQKYMTYQKVHTTQQDVKDVCSNNRLLAKVGMQEPMTAANDACCYLLEHVSAIKGATQKIKLLTDYSANTK